MPWNKAPPGSCASRSGRACVSATFLDWRRAHVVQRATASLWFRRLCSGGRGGLLLAHGPHVARHLQARKQLGIARISAHHRFVDTMRAVVGRKARPLFDELVTDSLLAVEAILLLLRDGGIAERHSALLGDAVADLLDVEVGDAIAGRDRHQKLRAERQRLWQNHDRLRESSRRL